VYSVVLFLLQQQLKADLRYKRSAPGARLTSTYNTNTNTATATASAHSNRHTADEGIAMY
jgi:hypothetical protein